MKKGTTLENTKKPWYVDASFDLSIWDIDFGDTVRYELEKVCRDRGLDPDDYEWDRVSVDVRAYKIEER